MLFSLNANTPECQVFEVLNNELLCFLQACIHATDFDDALFSRYQVNNVDVINGCWTNKPTREKFKALWDVLPEEPQLRQDLSDLVFAGQNVQIYFADTSIHLPAITNQDIFTALKSLTTHLFEHTKKILSVKTEANSSIQSHFQMYLRENNSRLCYCCGTEKLSQNREGLSDEEQWCAAYDHILDKAKYPIYAIHPRNFLPTCHICNSKAKGSSQLLIGKKGRRRKAFYPLAKIEAESCYQFCELHPKFLNIDDFVRGVWQQPLINVKFSFPNAPYETAKKIVVWKEVYQVPSRVENEFKTVFIESVSAGLIEPQNFKEFRERVTAKTLREPADLKKNAWACWWFRFYQWLSLQPENTLEEIWHMFEWKLGLASGDDLEAEDDHFATFNY